MQRAGLPGLGGHEGHAFPGKLVKGKRTKGFQIQNHNELLTHYRGAIGVKTGYTVAAKWTYIGAARRGGHTYLVTEMGLSQQGWRPATTMLDWAFAHGASATPVGHLVTPGELAAAAAAAGSTGATGAAVRRAAGALRAGVGRHRDEGLAGHAVGRDRRTRRRCSHRRRSRRERRAPPSRLTARAVRRTPQAQRRRAIATSVPVARRRAPTPTAAVAPRTAPAAIAVRSAERAPKFGSSSAGCGVRRAS